jgi:hypothetical protein
MEVPRTWVSEWFGYWSAIGDRSMNQWMKIADEVNERRYGPTQWMSDSIEFWNAAAVAWWSWLPDPTQLVPTLFINLDGGDAGPGTITRTVPIYRLRVPSGAPEWAYLRPIEGGDVHEINPSKVKLKWGVFGNELVVELFGPTAKKTAEKAVQIGVKKTTDPVPLKPGVYEGLVFVQTVPLAKVVIRVAKP